jgi:hypothetical protein
MTFLGDLAIEKLLTNDIDIEATEIRLNSYESISQPISASDAMRQRLQPSQNVNVGPTIVPFTAKAVAR